MKVNQTSFMVVCKEFIKQSLNYTAFHNNVPEQGMAA
jgi:hypothetical protein